MMLQAHAIEAVCETLGLVDDDLLDRLEREMFPEYLKASYDAIEFFLLNRDADPLEMLAVALPFYFR